MDGEREKFEAYYKDAGYVMIYRDGVYVDRFVQHMWHGWQARASLPSAQPSDVVEALRTKIDSMKAELRSLSRNPNVAWVEHRYNCDAELAALTTQQAQNNHQPKGD